MCSRPEGWIPDRTLKWTSGKQMTGVSKLGKISAGRIIRMGTDVKHFDFRQLPQRSWDFSQSPITLVLRQRAATRLSLEGRPPGRCPMALERRPLYESPAPIRMRQVRSQRMSCYGADHPSRNHLPTAMGQKASGRGQAGPSGRISGDATMPSGRGGLDSLFL